MNLKNITQEDITTKALSLYERKDFLKWLNDTLPKDLKVIKIYNRKGEEVDQVPNADFWLIDLNDTKTWGDNFTLDYNAIKRFYKGAK